MLLGEQLSSGRQLYGEVWTHISPLSGMVYWLCFELFGKTRWIYILLGGILSVYQAGMFNSLLIRKDVYNEKTYIPALLYIVFQAASIDFLILSPGLIALTFLLYMLKSILELSDRGKDQDIFRVGLSLGIATLLHFPTFAFIGVVVWGVGSFRVLAFRQLMLVLFGISIVWVGMGIYYLFLGIFPDFYQHYILANLTLSNSPYADWQGVLWLQALPVLMALWGFTKALGERSFVNFQVSCQWLMFIWLLSGVGSLLLSPQFAVYQLIVVLPAVSFFVAHAYLLQEKRWLAELSFVSVLALLLFLNFGHSLIARFSKLESPYEALVLPEPPWEVEGEQIWVLGEASSYYRNNRLATPFLNWELTESYLEQLDSYNVVTRIYREIEAQPPVFIVDMEGKMGELFSRAPLLKRNYEQDPQDSSIYRRKVDAGDGQADSAP